MEASKVYAWMFIHCLNNAHMSGGAEKPAEPWVGMAQSLYDNVASETEVIGIANAVRTARQGDRPVGIRDRRRYQF